MAQKVSLLRQLIRGCMDSCLRTSSPTVSRPCHTQIQRCAVLLGLDDFQSPQALDPVAAVFLAKADEAAEAAMAEMSEVENEAAARAADAGPGRSPPTADLDRVFRHKIRLALHHGHKEDTSLLGCKIPRTESHVPFSGTSSLRSRSATGASEASQRRKTVLRTCFFEERKSGQCLVKSVCGRCPWKQGVSAPWKQGAPAKPPPPGPLGLGLGPGLPITGWVWREGPCREC